jgi:Mg2+-importing ATPase
VETGSKTVFGKIAEKVIDVPEETAFDIGLRHFGSLITRVVFFLVLFVLLVNLALHRNGFESLLFAVALAVGLTPEFLPMITSVTLARGARRMADAQVIVKHLSAIQNMGSIDILCSDKTGTLTSGNMSLEHASDRNGQESAHVLELAALNS